MTDNRTNRPVPTGATHEVAVDEMFYSTTDAHGRIERVLAPEPAPTRVALSVLSS